MLFECLKEDSSQKITFILQTHPSKRFQKDMLEAWNFTKNKLRYRFTALAGTKQILLIVALMTRLCPDNQLT